MRSIFIYSVSINQLTCFQRPIRIQGIDELKGKASLVEEIRYLASAEAPDVGLRAASPQVRQRKVLRYISEHYVHKERRILLI